MPVRLRRALLPAVMLSVVALGACSDSTAAPTSSDPIGTPSGPLNVGDVVSRNVNSIDPCNNPTFHAVKVVAIGTHAMILNDTLNPKNGFTTADFQRVAARFDTLVYPLDVGNFGDPTDIDKNGHIGIIFTRAVNELTPQRSTQYVGGFTFSRDLFPTVATTRASACAGSNQGEYFYLLTPDPAGEVNGNVRTAGFVDSVTTGVLAHEFQHLINASRRLYVNNTAAFEAKWLDEGLAHIAEELLFYTESGLSPRMNLDLNAIRASSTTIAAYNAAMSGNQGRYRSYLSSPPTSSPYAANDSLSTRGAIWSLLRYSVDRLNAADGFTAGPGQTLSGSGSVTLTPGATIGDYSLTVVNTTLESTASIAYTLSTAVGPSSSVLPGSAPRTPDAVPMLRVAETSEHGVLQADAEFEGRMRSRERAVLTPLMSSARAWYATRNVPAPATVRRSLARSVSSPADADAALWFRLVNSPDTGTKNLQTLVGGNLAAFVRDWSVSHAVDDVAAPRTEYQQRSWNYHSIYPYFGSGYPLRILTLPTTTTIRSAAVAGGAGFYSVTVPANGSVTVSLSAPAGAQSSNLQLIAVRTR